MSVNMSSGNNFFSKNKILRIINSIKNKLASKNNVDYSSSDKSILDRLTKIFSPNNMFNSTEKKSFLEKISNLKKKFISNNSNLNMTSKKFFSEKIDELKKYIFSNNRNVNMSSGNKFFSVNKILGIIKSLKNKLPSKSNVDYSSEKSFLDNLKNKLTFSKNNINLSSKKSLSEIFKYLKNKINSNNKNINFSADKKSKLKKYYTYLYKEVKKLLNTKKDKINLTTKSTITINIKDIINPLNIDYDINYINYINNFKKKINNISKINELKNQNYANICMFYIDKITNFKNKYIS
jgi:hypothetical protein